MESPTLPAPDDSVPASSDPDAEYQRVRAALATPARESFGNLVAVVSLAIYVATLGPRGFTLSSAVLLMVVLLIHELGHLAMMKLFGYRDLKVFFVPWLGALASGKAVAVASWRRAVVLLAGPLPGLGIGLFLLVLSGLRPEPVVREAAVTFLGLNGFNLLPLGFLDGGQLLSALFFGPRPRAEAAFQGITLAILAWMAFAGHSWLLFAIVLLALLGVPARYRLARASIGLRPAFAQARCPLHELPDEQLRLLYQAARSLAPPRMNDPLRSLASTMSSLYERVTTPAASLGVALGFGAIWVGAFFALFVGLVILALLSHPGSATPYY